MLKRIAFVLLSTSFIIFAAETIVDKVQSPAPVKKVVVVKPYVQQIKDAKAQYLAQVANLRRTKEANDAIINKTKEANEAIINKTNLANQALSTKADSLLTVYKNKLKDIYDTEMEKIRSTQMDLDQQKTTVENEYKNTLFELPQSSK